MPHALRTQYGYADHGAIYQILFSNPTGKNQTIVAGYDIKSSLTYLEKNTGYRKMISSSDVFYDPGTKTEYGEVKLAPGDSKRVYAATSLTTRHTTPTAARPEARPTNPQYVFGPINISAQPAV
jgi:hypothetical protein